MKRALLFGGVPILAGIALIVVWVRADQAASRGNDWTQVLGTIETAAVRAGGVDIAYRYEHGGRQHRNPAGRLTLRPGSTASAAAAARYTPGRQILTYVNPDAPAESQLEPKPRPGSANLITGAVLIVIGLPIAFYFLRGTQPPRLRKTKSGRKPTRPAKPSNPMSRLKAPPSVPRK